MSPLSGVISEAWQLYRRFAAHFLVIAFVISLVAAVIEGVLAGYGGRIGLGFAALIRYIALCLIQAALVKAVQDVRDGRVDLDFGETVSAVTRFILPVAVASFLAAIGIWIGLVLIIVPGLILLTFWSLIVPSIVVGGSGPISAFSRSWRTVRGYAWHVFGTYVLVFLIYVAVSIVIGLILLALPFWLRDSLGSLIAGTLLLPFVALVVTLMYFRLTRAHGQQAEGEPATSGGPGLAQPGPA
jgi:hypothetical protein